MTNHIQNVQLLSRGRVAAALVSILGVGSAGAIAADAVSAASTKSKNQVSVADDVFKPTKMKIKKGQQIKWVWNSQNLDAHNVTLLKAPSGVSKFHSKTKSRNYSYSHKFTVAGKYTLICTIHPGMGMTVTVK